MPELDRRDFLKLVGAGGAGAAAAGCEPVEHLIPYVIQPEEITPGIAVHYASTCTECPAGCGLHVKTREGRPIKLEGNPQHPVNQGALCARGQAGIGRTYHPDRYEGPEEAGSRISWEDAHAIAGARVRESRGKVWFFGGRTGPTLSRLIDDFIAGAGGGGRVVYEPFGNEALRQASSKVFGVLSTPIFDLRETDFILDLGSDFLESGPSATELARQFTEARAIEQHPDGGARLVSVTPRLSMTASRAEQWIPAKPGAEGLLALALAKKVAGRARGSAGPAAGLLAGVSVPDALAAADIDAATLDALAEKLLAAKNPVVLPPGVSLATTTTTDNIGAALLLNAVLGAVGRTVKIPPTDALPPTATVEQLRAFVKAANAGQVAVLFLHDTNPVYSLPPELGFEAALAKVGTVISTASLRDETSQKARLVLPDTTPLESWGDVAPREGIRSLIQPTVRPLHDVQGLGDTLLALGELAGIDTLPEGPFRKVLERAWSGVDFRRALDRGGEWSETPTEAAVVADSAAQLAPAAPQLAGRGEFALVAYPHAFLGDGRGAALPWLQETPDPVTKIAWWTWVEMSLAACERLGVDFGSVVRIETEAGAIEASVLPRGGIRDDVIAVPTGQGHTVGHYASENGAARGANVMSILPLASDGNGARAWLTSNASVEPTGGYRRLALSQWTDNQRGRGLAQEVSLLALAKEGHGASEGHGEGGDEAAAHGGEHGGEHELLLPYEMANDAHPESEYRWAMTIDNDKCSGCSACVVACAIENNVPVVGEEGALRHREMHWLRIERYIGEGDREGGSARRPYPDRERLGEVNVRLAPMLCQQCGAAPCESVCPVIATYHTPEGINGMVYNRCVGTRYCANNCTYKVRRFNYFDYSQENWPGLLGLMANPDVTVRQQGVMEKCTFCYQRIAAARQDAKDEGRPIADGEVRTACQQACPTGAISFGNSRDPKSEVMKDAKQPARAYHSLHVLNTRPGITYLAQVAREDDERSHA